MENTGKILPGWLLCLFYNFFSYLEVVIAYWLCLLESDGYPKDSKSLVTHTNDYLQEDFGSFVMCSQTDILHTYIHTRGLRGTEICVRVPAGG